MDLRWIETIDIAVYAIVLGNMQENKLVYAYKHICKLWKTGNKEVFQSSPQCYWPQRETDGKLSVAYL